MLAVTETGCALFSAACIVPYSISSIRRETPTSFLFCWLLLLLLLSYTQGVQYIYSHPISFFFFCLSFARHEKSLSPPTGGMCTRTSLAALPTSVHDRAKREWSKTPPSIGLTFSFGFVHPPSLRARFESVSNRNGMRVKREQFHLRLAR